MSRTDKTRPLWVQFRDPGNRRFMEEKHDHEDGVCTFDAWFADATCFQTWPHSWGYSCFLYHSYYGGYHNEFWARPRKGSWDRTGSHGAIRARWRATRSKLLRGEDVDLVTPTTKEYKTDHWKCFGW